MAHHVANRAIHPDRPAALMLAIRRVYLYLVLTVSIIMVLAGAVGLAQQIVALGLVDISGEGIRRGIAESSAVALVGVLVWTAHWIIALRLTADPTESESALRRLYLAGTAALFMIVLGLAIANLIANSLDALRGLTEPVTAFTDPIFAAIIAAVLWPMTLRVPLGETTIRRLYVFGVAFWGLYLLTSGTADLVRVIWDAILGQAPIAGDPRTSGAVARALAGLAIWIVHWRYLAAPGDSTMKTVYLVAAFGLAVVVTLFQASQVLFYGLSRLLGVTSPGGQVGPVTALIAEPVSLGSIYAVSWWYHRRALGRSVGGEGVRRFARYLVALVALTLFAVGIGGILWIVGDLLTARASVGESFWREQMSLFVTLIAVGVPAWLLSWRPVVEGTEAASLSRRLYLYLGLLGGVLAALGAAAVGLFQLFLLLVGADRGGALADMVRAAAVAGTGGVVAAYQWWTIRREPAAAPRTPEGRLTLTDGTGRRVREARGDPDQLATLFDILARQVAPSATISGKESADG